MKTIIAVKYMGPTNKLGARVKATCFLGSYTMPYNHGVPNAFAHAAESLAAMHWPQTAGMPFEAARGPNDNNVTYFIFDT